MAVHTPTMAALASVRHAISPRLLTWFLSGSLTLGGAGMLAASFHRSAPAAVLRLTVSGPVSAGKVKIAALQAASATPSSGPIALSPDDKFAWMVDPENDRVTVVRVEGDAKQIVAQLPVGREPACVAISPQNNRAFVTNSVDGTLTVIAYPWGDPVHAQVLGSLSVGTEPFGVLVSPDASRVYVANRNSGDVTVIANEQRQIAVLGAILNVGYQPTGLAFADGRLYVTQFLAQLRDNDRPVDKNEAADDGKEGRITVINTASNKIEKTIALNPLAPAKVGFQSNGSTLDRIPPRKDAAGNDIFDFDTGCFPNVLWSLAIKNGRAYVPAIGSSPNGPFRFNVNVQSVLSVVNLDAGAEETNKTINMNKGIGGEKVGTKLFFSNPSAIAFKPNANEGYVVATGIDQVFRVTLAADGTPSVGAPNPVRIFTTADPNADYTARGKNPRGIVINSAGTRAYVACPLSEDIAVLDLTTNQRLANIPIADLPARNTFAGIKLRGKQLFHSSIGPAGTRDDSKPPAGRMSNFGWANCASCHPDGRVDGVTWMFPDGPRQTISLDATFDHQFPNNQVSLEHVRILNWSAVRDEVQDFELNTRAVSGGEGLIRDGRNVINLINPDGTGEANSNRDPDLEALAVYQAYGIRTPVAPPISSADFVNGAKLFAAANCVDCHSGRQWSTSIRNFSPPPKSDRGGTTIAVADAQLSGFLRKVGTFDAANSNELKANANVSNAVPPARGDLGLNPPTLLGLAASAPYFHSGQARTLEEVMNNVAHRTAGSPGQDLFADAGNRALMVKFLRSIDANKPFFAGP